MDAGGKDRGLIEWLENVDARVKALEARPGVVSLGRWVIAEDDAGNLTVRNTLTGVTTVIASA